MNGFFVHSLLLAKDFKQVKMNKHVLIILPKQNFILVEFVQMMNIHQGLQFWLKNQSANLELLL
ncbi:unnamed protein product [Paramecium primaurelia]|uniref:Uncharacterized protein n=1 Tax=Paramecium primaurelia TaxID=5886 RepID=A0A8S1PKD7_PARPR|nr:unnamed protein product [Paramecium primaurelia]